MDEEKKKVTLEKIPASEPWSGEHLMCPSCDGTFIVDDPIFRLRAENERLKKELTFDEKAWFKSKRYRKALEFYGDESNYHDRVEMVGCGDGEYRERDWPSAIHEDAGKLAIEALGRKDD